MAGPVETTQAPSAPLTDEAQLGRPDLGPPPFSSEAQLGAPGTPGLLPLPDPTPLQDLSARIFRQEEALRGAQADERKRLIENADRSREESRRLQEAMYRLALARNQRLAYLDARKPQIAPPPPRQITQFLAPVAGESVMATTMKLLQGITLFATGLGGLAKGDARAGLAAFSGAMRGWAEGDDEKARRELATWKGHMESAINNWTIERDSYLDWIGSANLSLDNMLKGAEMDAKVRGNEQAARAFATGEQATGLKFLEDQFRRMHEMQQDIATFNYQVQKHEQDAADRRERDRQAHEDRQARIATDAAYKSELIGLKRDGMEQRMRELDLRLADRALDRQSREELSRERMALMEQFRRLALDQKMIGKRYYDRDQGEIREITSGEHEADAPNLMAGHPRFSPLTQAEVGLLNRLAVSPPILDRLEQLVSKINDYRPGANLTNGYIQYLKEQAGIGADIQEFLALNVDVALETAASLSGGQPRIAILHILREEGQAHEFMTTDVALRTIQTARTTIYNRGARDTGDIQTIPNLARILHQYAPSPLEGGVGKVTFGAPGATATPPPAAAPGRETKEPLQPTIRFFTR